ncbi:hypothetical protein GBF35_17055 [Nonomuraea phyllanthi]|nr:hypothetical protein GBF35_17055 [Nonomuraea phyllanthi]
MDVDVCSLTRQPLLAGLASGELDAALLLDTGLRIGGLGFPLPPAPTQSSTSEGPTRAGAAAGARAGAGTGAGAGTRTGAETRTGAGTGVGGGGSAVEPGHLDFVDVGEVKLSLVAAPDGDREPLLVSAPGCSIRLAADRTFGAEVPRRELTSIATAREWARQGLGSALLPDFVLEPDLASGALVTLDSDAPPLALRLVWLRGREPALRDVLYAMST